MGVIFAAMLLLFGLMIPSDAEVGYKVVPCAVVEAGKITNREVCGLLPKYDADVETPDPYIGGDAGSSE